ncbi:hypothetical protein E2C01_065483 [Portunus trituberculatus]|uniref:Uncharacterized protein n=1 Tax=Portunus trituberculatus TaxID=210409 RepID=A0A5B7HEP9_PORTR|nr:hypothetical protein [Portunus trituberculatus]
MGESSLGLPEVWVWAPGGWHPEPRRRGTIARMMYGRDRLRQRGAPLSGVMAIMRVAGGGRPAGLPRGALLQQGSWGAPQGSAGTPCAHAIASRIPNQFRNDYR